MNDNALFRTILKRSWDLIILRPAMWLLAFFAAAVAGVGVVDAAYGAWRIMSEAAAPTINFTSQTGSAVLTWLTPPYSNIFFPLFALLFLAIGVALFLVSVISLGGLIRAAVDKKEHSLKSSWNQGVVHMWDLAALVIIRRVVIGVLLIIAVLISSYALRHWGDWGSILTGIILVAFMFVISLISMLAIYAQTAVVAEQVGCIESIKKSYAAFKLHVLVSIEMAIVLFAVELAFVAVSVLLFFLIAAPIFLLFVVTNITGLTFISAAGFLIGGLLISALSFLMAAWSTQFTVASWAYLYVKIRKERIMPRIFHFFGKK